MSDDKNKNGGEKAQKPSAPVPASKSAPVAAAPVTAARSKLPPMFRRVDWLTFALTAGVIWIIYVLTLAPELTLEDSGELCTGSFYAGIPHPPGYPVWTLYTWLFTKIIPFGNVAWRVALAEATAGAIACGLVSMIVSRGSSMLMEGVAELKDMTGKWEKAICLVAGVVAGLVFGLDTFMWKESVVVNRVCVFSVPWFLTMLLLVLRWMYSPNQNRYLYWAFFMYGLSITTHQSLLVASIALEIVIAATKPRLGRDIFFANSMIYIVIILIKLFTHNWVFANLSGPMFSFLFHSVGGCSILACIALSIITREFFTEIIPVLVMGLLFTIGVGFYLYMAVGGMTDPPMQWAYPRTVDGFLHAISRGQYQQPDPTNLFIAGGIWRFVQQLGYLVTGLAEEYTWVYMFIALVPFIFFFKLRRRERVWILGLAAFYLCNGVLLMMLMNPSPERASVDLVKVFFISSHAIFAILVGYGMALVASFMATHYSVFRIWGVAGVAISVVAALAAGLMAGSLSGMASRLVGDHLPQWFLVTADGVLAGLLAAMIIGAVPAIAYLIFKSSAEVQKLITKSRLWGIAGVVAGVGIGVAVGITTNELGGGAAGLVAGIVAGIAAGLFAWVIAGIESGSVAGVVAAGGIAAVLAIYSLIDATRHHFGGRDGTEVQFSQVPHWIGQAFAPHMFGMPVIASLILLAMPFMFIAALLVYRNRAPLSIAFALFAIMPLYAGLSHWNRSEQRNHWFGYWFGHDMFTPPFGIYPEMTRDAILYGGTDPGRFCPTYMIFCDSFIPDRCKPKEDQKFDRRDVYIITQNALADGTYLEYLRAQYNRSAQIDPPFFQSAVQRVMDMGRSKEQQEEDRLNGIQRTNFLSKIAYKLLDRPFIARGAKIENRWRGEGVYPPKEIYIASDVDSANCFNAFYTDARQRLEHDMRYPNEPKQIRPGEEVNIDNARGTISVGGNTAVMAINGLITKVIFDHNPTNEFFLEESFPLDWMYPYLSPYGIIMKINRKELPEITEDMVKKDHAFWSEYSKRFIGNWITYDTKVSEIANWAERLYLRHDFTGFTGDRKFIRDEDAQKAFSKLRSSIAASVYDWRFRQARTAQERERMLKEADFAYRQAIAFCPYSPEAVFHYVKLLADVGRFDDALLVAETCFKLDPDNSVVQNLVKQLKDVKGHGSMVNAAEVEKLEKEFHDHPDNAQYGFNLMGAYSQMQQPGKAMAVAEQLEKTFRDNPTNAQLAFNLMTAYEQIQQPGRAMALAELLEKEVTLHPGNTQLAVALMMHYHQLQQGAKANKIADRLLTNSASDQTTLISLASYFAQNADYSKLELALEQLVKREPNSPETWFDLAGLKMMLNKTSEVIPDLKHALEENARRLAVNPKAPNLEPAIYKDPRFHSISNTPEFQKLFAPK